MCFEENRNNLPATQSAITDMMCIFCSFLCSRLKAGSVDTLYGEVAETRTGVWCFYELSVWHMTDNGRTLFICLSSGFMELSPSHLPF